MRNYLALLFVLFAMIVNAQKSDLILPKPDTTGGIPIMKALYERSSAREFSETDLSMQDLSDLCWAAWGINRVESGKRTAPSSRNFQEMDLYVVLKTGVFVYNAQKHLLEIVKEGDLRDLCGTQEFVGKAPVNFLYIADLRKRNLEKPEDITDKQLLSSWANAGFMSQNVYLVCASKDFSTVIRAMIDRDKLQNELGLNPMQRIILGQTIGKSQK